MLFFVRKFVEAFFLPVELFAVLVIVAVILRRRMLAAAAALLLCILAMRFTARLLLSPLEDAYGATPVAACPQADAIVTLSGMIVRGVSASGVEWGTTAGRYLTALELARAGKARLLIFTGAKLDDGSGLTEGEVLRTAAAGQGISPERIRVTGQVWTTNDEAQEVSRMAGVHSIILVTSAFHMPRAAMLFRARGLQVVPFPADRHFPGHVGREAVAFLPTAEGLRDSDAALREYYGLAVYRLLLPLRRGSAARSGTAAAYQPAHSSVLSPASFTRTARP